MNEKESKNITAQQLSYILNTIKSPTTILIILELQKNTKTLKQLLKLIDNNSEQKLRSSIRKLQRHRIIYHTTKNKIKSYHILNNQLASWLYQAIDLIK